MPKTLLGAEQTVSKSEGSLSGCCPDVISMERLLSIDNVAKILGVTKATIYSWTSQKKIPHIKLSKRLLKFRENELMCWIDKRAINSDTERVEGAKARQSNPSLSLHDDHIERIIRKAKEEVLHFG